MYSSNGGVGDRSGAISEVQKLMDAATSNGTALTPPLGTQPEQLVSHGAPPELPAQIVATLDALAARCTAPTAQPVPAATTRRGVELSTTALDGTAATALVPTAALAVDTAAKQRRKMLSLALHKSFCEDEYLHALNGRRPGAGSQSADRGARVASHARR